MFRQRLARRLLHTSRRVLDEETKKKKPPMPLRESLEIDDTPITSALLSVSIVGILALGYYLHNNNYMHHREQGVLEATPAPLQFLVQFVQQNVPQHDMLEKQHHE
jgi:hypothetical protein|tara:strand:- start:498 stop:815 length:318 start_codon:yes stop_codon:yes gene_type:complete